MKKLTEYIKPWCEHERVQRGRQPSGVDRYRRTVEMFLAWCKEKGKPEGPSSIDRADIDEFMKWLFYDAGNTKNSSRANKLSALKSYFRYLTYCGAILRDPTKGVPTPKFQKVLPKVFTTEDLGLILSEPDTTKIMGLRDKAVLYTIYAGALRVSEICGLTIEDVIDPGSGSIRLNIIG
ncbi:MAG: phage integrase N-terminal SAM-like domain-containing protein, partial [Nitrospirota bacterium]|nr:phage integrase N-terminal SAM-like domain-containing protein [Nitrospirota bacterium]